MGITEEMLSRKVKVDFGEELKVQEDEAKAWATIWSAGQGVSSIHDSPKVSQLIENLKIEFKEAIIQQQTLLAKYQ